jgi:hypothetical protein
MSLPDDPHGIDDVRWPPTPGITMSLDDLRALYDRVVAEGGNCEWGIFKIDGTWCGVVNNTIVWREDALKDA